MQQLAEITPRHRFADAQHFRFVGRTPLGSKDQIHQRRNVRVVAGVTLPRMMPVLQFGRADEHPQRTDWQAHVRIGVDGPDAATEGICCKQSPAN